jgi:alcohol dehydrogenase
MYYLPTRIFFGLGALGLARDRIARLGRKALVVTGRRGAKASGALDEVLRLLRDYKIGHMHFNRVEPNPSTEVVMAGKAAFGDCDFVIGIGGGSPIDAAKAIALAKANDLAQGDLYDTSRFRRNYPVVAIPTTAGTGAEATQYSVLTDAARKKKAGFGHDLAFPLIAVCDPAYTQSQPAEVTRDTAIDALSHLLEGIYSSQRNPLLYPLVHWGVKSVVENLGPALDDPSDLSRREALMRAALYGGFTIAHTGTTFQHAAGYPLTSNFGVSHGLANGLVMKQVMEFYYPALKTELDALFSAVGLSRDAFQAWLDSLELKAELALTDAFIDNHIPEVMSSRNMTNNPFEVSAEQVRQIYHGLRDQNQ